MTDTEKAGQKQRGRPWQKGQSGNPAGRPKGARNRTTRLAEALVSDEAEKIIRATIDAALQGEVSAQRALLDRLLPPLRDRPLTIDLPDLDGAGGITDAMARVLAAVASGDLTPSEGQAMAALIEAHRRAVETAELEARIAALEDKT